eukprot:gene11010-3716_t
MNIKTVLFLCFFLLVYSKDICINSETYYPFDDKLRPKCFKDSLEEKLFKTLKLSVHNAHSEVLFEWLNNLELLKGQKHSLVHFDSHPDSSSPRPLTLDMIFDDKKPWKKIQNGTEIDIANFVMPMVFAGIIDKFIWIHLPYDGFSDEISEECYIGTKIEDPTNIGMTCEFSLFPNYFVNSTDLLINKQKFTFIAINFGSGTFKNLKLNPSNTLLDIDEDFFSTNSPTHTALEHYFGQDEVKKHIKIFNVENYCMKKFQQIYPHIKDNLLTPIPHFSKIDDGLSSNETYMIRLIQDDILIPCIEYHDKKKFMNCAHIAQKIWCEGEKNAVKYLNYFFDFIQYFFDVDGSEGEQYVDEIVRAAFQSFSLPQFVYPKRKIRKLKNEMMEYLKEIGLNFKPKMITIAQSDTDGHTPKHLIDFIKFEIYDLLNTLYAQKN